MFPSWGKLPFTTDGAAPSTVAEQSSSSSGGVARASVPGWSNPHRPRVERATRRIGRTNAHRPRAPRKCNFRGWLFVGAGGVAPRATEGGDLSPEALTNGGLSRITSN